MLKTDPRHSSHWWRENWQLPQSWGVCTRCGIKILKSHIDNGVCRDVIACEEKRSGEPAAKQEYLGKFPDPVAMARTEDGSPVVAFQPHGLEVRAFGVDDLDARGLPRWKP